MSTEVLPRNPRAHEKILEFMVIENKYLAINLLLLIFEPQFIWMIISLTILLTIFKHAEN